MFVTLVGVNTDANAADDCKRGNLFLKSLGWFCYAVAIVTGSPEMTGLSLFSCLWGNLSVFQSLFVIKEHQTYSVPPLEFSS